LKACFGRIENNDTRESRRQILFVGENEQRCAVEFRFGKQFPQLVGTLSNTFPIGRVDNINHAFSVLIIVFPQSSNLGKEKKEKRKV
jgi:hypothetical protein